VNLTCIYDSEVSQVARYEINYCRLHLSKQHRTILTGLQSTMSDDDWETCSTTSSDLSSRDILQTPSERATTSETADSTYFDDTMRQSYEQCAADDDDVPSETTDDAASIASLLAADPMAESALVPMERLTPGLDRALAGLRKARRAPEAVAAPKSDAPSDTGDDGGSIASILTTDPAVEAALTPMKIDPPEAEEVVEQLQEAQRGLAAISARESEVNIPP
jgi:hypothetical protein